jgi:hypothetical protein
MSNTTRLPLALSMALLGLMSCSSPSNGGNGPGSAGSGSSSPGSAGTNGAAGTSAGGTGAGQAGDGGGPAGTSAVGAAGSGTMMGAAGTSGAAGAAAGSTGLGTAGTVGAAGTAGTAGAGAAGAGAAGTTGAAGSGLEPGDTPPWRALNVTAPPALYVHGGNAGVDTRAKSLGKLAVTLGVSGGGYSAWLGKRGYHVMGASFGECNAPNLGAGRDAVGTCRLGEFAMISAQVKAGLTSLAASAPKEDWGYFLNQDGSVRWSDVAFTGVSHGATTAALIGHIGVRIWRAVSCAGPRDNTCGKGPFTLPYDPAHPPFDPACPDANIASWLDMPSKTPMNRFYGIDGVTDGQYGDINFNMERTKYPGQPVQFDVAGAVLTGTNRFVSQAGGHLDFLNVADNIKPLNTDKVLNIAFGIPPENQNPTF